MEMETNDWLTSEEREALDGGKAGVNYIPSGGWEGGGGCVPEDTRGLKTGRSSEKPAASVRMNERVCLAYDHTSPQAVF